MVSNSTNIKKYIHSLQRKLQIKKWCVVDMIVWYLDLHVPVQSEHITIKVVSSNPAQMQVYSIQHYVIKFVRDLQQFGGFLQVFRFLPPIELTATI
jgi:hypothetical protein